VSFKAFAIVGNAIPIAVRSMALEKVVIIIAMKLSQNARGFRPLGGSATAGSTILSREMRVDPVHVLDVLGGIFANPRGLASKLNRPDNQDAVLLPPERLPHSETCLLLFPQS
jgi:hypothetical protein